jgi:ankyrin repeat protein
VDVNQQVSPGALVMPLAVRAARLPRTPTTALELAIAMKDVGLVELLMEHGAILKVCAQLNSVGSKDSCQHAKA